VSAPRRWAAQASSCSADGCHRPLDQQRPRVTAVRSPTIAISGRRAEVQRRACDRTPAADGPIGHQPYGAADQQCRAAVTLERGKTAVSGSRKARRCHEILAPATNLMVGAGLKKPPAPRPRSATMTSARRWLPQPTTNVTQYGPKPRRPHSPRVGIEVARPSW
jgi:hypothetical protein